MDGDKRRRLTPRQRVRPYHGRSTVYAWLRAHHTAVEGFRATTPCIWAELALDMAEDGILPGGATRTDANNIRMTYARVCRDVAAALAAEQALVAKVRSRSTPPGSRPVVVSTAAPASSPTPASVLPAPRSQTPSLLPSPAPTGSSVVAGPAGDADAAGERHAAEETARIMASLRKHDAKFRL